MADRNVIIRDFGPNVIEAINVMTEIFGGDVKQAVDAVQSVPQSLKASGAQIDKLRSIGANVETWDDTIVLEPASLDDIGKAVTNIEGGPGSLHISSGYLQDWMQNDPVSGGAVFRDAKLLMIDRINAITDIFQLLQAVLADKAPLIILAGSIDKSVLEILRHNSENGIFDTVCVLVDNVDNTFAEAAAKFGGTPVYTSRGMNTAQLGPSVLGEVKHAKIDSRNTILDVTEISESYQEQPSMDDFPAPEQETTASDKSGLDTFMDFFNELHGFGDPFSFKNNSDSSDAFTPSAAPSVPSVSQEIPSAAPSVPSAPQEVPSAAPEFEDEPEFVFSGSAGDQKYSSDTKAWGGWAAMPDGHNKAVTAMRALRDRSNHFRSELNRVRQDLADEKDNSQRIYESVTENARQTCSNDSNRAAAECTANLDRAERARNRVSSVLNSSNYFVNNLPKVNSVIQAASTQDAVAKQQAAVVYEKIAKKAELYKKLRNAKITTAERIRQDKIDKARKEQIDRDEQSERKFKLLNQQLQDECRQDVEAGFNKETTSAYVRDVQASRFNADNFECVDSVPDYVMLGKIGLSLPEADADDIAVVQAVDLQTSQIGDKSSSEYSVEIPYAQRLFDGISLLMRYKPENRQFAQSKIQDLVMKLFMSFPAGKIEATMIDPLALGASFPDIPKLGASPYTARVIDTKVWSSEKDIEKCISTLRQRLENMTQDYGDDRESRLKKEVVRVLAITDFPVNFNESALKDLHAIVRNSASLGVCVFICANDKELESLRGRSNALFDEIMGSMVQTRAEGNKLMMTSSGNEGLYIKLDDMSDVDANKSSIIDYMVDAITHSVRRLEKFEELYSGDIFDSNTWGLGDQSEIAVPIGIKGADNVVKFVVGRGGGSTEHHALVSGLTGAGKSTFLHTLITSTMISYRPEDVQMYILDFKEGVEFNVYTRYRLPSLRVVALNSEREFGLNVLKELCTELDVRTKHFARYGVTDISSYQKLMDVPKVPKLLLIFDEVQELFRSKGDADSISAECLSCINKLVMQGRAMGIHLVLATQDFRNCSGLEQFFTQMSIRIAIAGTEEGASSILNSDNKGIRTLQNQPAGAAIYNSGGGVESANNFFQIAYLADEVRDRILTSLDTYYRDPAIASMYEDEETRILLTNAEENINNCFNRLILEGPSSLEPLGDDDGGYGLLLGQGFGKKSTFVPVIKRGAGENLLIVSKDEKTAMSLFELSAMSLLYDELNTDADKGNALIYFVDLSSDVTDKDECDFDYLCKQFARQLEIAKLRDVRRLIDDLYETVMGRAEGRLPQDERIFLMFFGVNRARMLTTAGIYEGTSSDELSAADKLSKILTAGPRLGVNTIMWSESIKGTEAILGQRFDGMFSRRIAYGLTPDDMERLVAEEDTASLRGKTAVYMNIAEDIKNTHFRPYDVPAKVWIERYAEVYEEIVADENMYDNFGENGGFVE